MTLLTCLKQRKHPNLLVTSSKGFNPPPSPPAFRTEKVKILLFRTRKNPLDENRDTKSMK
jgi:hypothetical protein